MFIIIHLALMLQSACCRYRTNPFSHRHCECSVICVHQFRGAHAQSEDGATWPQQTGQDFSQNFALPDIDFSEIHMWPDDWSEVRGDVLASASAAWAQAMPNNTSLQRNDTKPTHHQMPLHQIRSDIACAGPAIADVCHHVDHGAHDGCQSPRQALHC